VAFVDGNTSQAVACWMGTRMSELKTLKEIMVYGMLGLLFGASTYDLAMGGCFSAIITLQIIKMIGKTELLQYNSCMKVEKRDE